MKNWLIENIFSLITALFGGGSFYAYWVEKNKRKIEEKQLSTDALKSMQTAYDDFVVDARERYNELKDEVIEMKRKLNEVSSMLNDEQKKYITLQVSYDSLKLAYENLKFEFEKHKKQTK